MDEQIIVHLFDNSKDSDEVFPVYVNTNAVPRKGDQVHWWLDYPQHQPRSFEDGEPIKIDGTVARVEFDFRQMEYHRRRDVTQVSVFLDDYKVTMPRTPHQGTD